MFRRIFQRRDGIATALYGAIVAQARQPAFYGEHGVPDTVEGRFEMLVLHGALVVRLLKSADAEAGQGVFDLFCADMDRTLREMGVGDLAVPKRMRKLGEAFYGRSAAYDAALLAGDEAALAGAIGRNVFAGEARPVATAALADYMMAADRALASIPLPALRSGTLRFPAPETFFAVGARP